MNARGNVQARKAGLALKSYAIDIIYSSDLKRAKETAVAIKKHHPNVRIVYDNLLRERDFGELEGAREDKINWKALLAGRYSGQGVETKKLFRLRVRKFLMKIKPIHKNSTVLIVTHGGTLRRFFEALIKTNLAKEYPEIPNASISVIEVFRGKKPIVHKLFCIKHLGKAL